jgi:hypothetical protein
MDKQYKKFTMIENIKFFKHGQYQIIQPKAEIINCMPEVKIPNPKNIPNIIVVNDDPITMCKQLFESGQRKITLLNPVSFEFLASNIDASEGFRYDFINIRTNLFLSLTNNMNKLPLPLKAGSVIYSDKIVLIRDERCNVYQNVPTLLDEIRKNNNGTINFYNPEIFNKVFNTLPNISIITAQALYEPNLINNHLRTQDYADMLSTVEAIFQTAFYSGTEILILTDFGCREDKNPLSDIVRIFNNCLYKYGHLFKYIVFSIPILTKEDIDNYNYFNEHIIRLQDEFREYLASV